MKQIIFCAAGAILMFFAPYLAGQTLPSGAQTSSAAVAPVTAKSNTLDRLTALHLPRLEGAVPVLYSEGAKPQALRFQKSVGDCVAWYSQHLQVSVPVTVAVLNHADWDKVGRLWGYPMPQARRDSSLLVLPDSLKDFPGQSDVSDPYKKLEFISFHETGHLFQQVLQLNAPDAFLEEFYATALASSYALAQRPDLRSAMNETRAGARPRYTSFEDMDLVYIGVGYDNYDWFQIQIVRLASYFVEGQDLATLISELRAAFPVDKPMNISEVIDKLNAIRPGFRAAAGDLALPTSLPFLTPHACNASPSKTPDTSVIGIRNFGDRPASVTQDGRTYEVTHEARQLHGNVGDQIRLPSGQCVTFPQTPAYIDIK